MKKKINIKIIKNPPSPIIDKIEEKKSWKVTKENILTINNNPLKLSENSLDEINIDKYKISNKLKIEKTIDKDNYSSGDVSIEKLNEDNSSIDFLTMVSLARNKRSMAKKTMKRFSPDQIPTDNFSMIEQSINKSPTIHIDWKGLDYNSNLIDFYGENHRKLIRHIRRRFLETNRKEFYLTRKDANERDGVVERHYRKCLRELAADGFFYWEIRKIKGVSIYWIKLA